MSPHRIIAFPGDGPRDVVCRACRRPIYLATGPTMRPHMKHTPKRK